MNGKKKVVEFKLLVAGILLVQSVFLALPCFANSMTYTAPTSTEPGKFTGELPISRIGPLALPDGLVKFSEDEMLVQAVPEWLFDREQVLRGAIVRAEVATQKASSVVAGLVFFIDGSWLPNLGPRRTPDEITTNSGELVVGRIASRSGQAFVVQPAAGGVRKINFSDVKSIKSPRAFSFNIPTPTARISPTDNTISFQSNLISVAPSTTQPRLAFGRASVPRNPLDGTNQGASGRAIATFVALDVFSEIAPAVSIPLVLNPITQRHAIRQISSALHTQLGLPQQ